VVFDWENWWALSHTDHPIQLDYGHLIQRWYAALHTQHVSIDIVQPTGDLSPYALVIVPQLYLLTDAGARNLNSYTSQGGHLFVSAFTDVVDKDDAFREGGFLVGLGDALGITVEEFGALVPPSASSPAPSAGAVSFAQPLGSGLGQAHSTVSAPFGDLHGEYFAEEIRPLGADVIGTLIDGRLAGHPALTRKAHGAGAGIYLATIPDDAGMRAVLGWALQEAGVSHEIQGLSPWIEAARRGDVLTLINHGTEKQSIDVQGTNILTGATIDGIKLDSFAWRMLRVNPKHRTQRFPGEAR
jgi:beta-galactosidase